MILSLLVDRLLVGIFIYETQWDPDLRSVCVVLEYAPRNGITRVRLERVMVDYNVSGLEAEWTEPSAGKGELKLHLRLARIHLYELLGELIEVPDVHAVRQMPRP